MGVPEALRFDAGQGGLIRAVMTAGGAEAHVYLHGAHVLHFQPAGQPPALFASRESRFETGKPIRGGVPICFPWFGPRAGDASAAMHGFARDRNWKFKTVERLPDGSINVTLVLKWSPTLLQLWPHRFTATHSITLDARGDRLTMELAVKNLGAPEPAPAPFSFEAALHTYLAVGDVHQATVTGLENASYIDKTDSFARKQQPAEPIRVTGETDRVFVNAAGATTLHDPALKRRIVIEKSNSNSTVVWNPWVDKSKAMADFGDDEWPGMICIETANVADNAVTLKPKQGHTMKAVVRVEGM
jgi:glucose-6-phosphate 1-epimerase